jgi:hypothetical protein
MEMVTAISIVLICAFYLWLAPVKADAEMIDHGLFRITVQSMRDGSDYYSAYDEALDIVYGPTRAGVTETIRGFRLPTTFFAWHLLPNDQYVWWLFVGISGLAGIAASKFLTRPVLGVLVVVYLLSIGMLIEGGRWTAQFMTTELWAVPPLFGAVLMARRERWWLAAGLALLATLIRELAAPFLLVGTGLALLGRVPRAPWFTAFGIAALAYAGHVALVIPHIDPNVVQNPIIDDVALPWTIIEMMGFALPAGVVIGPVLWGFAVWHVISQRWILDASLLALPLVGVIIDRPYWGILVVPFAIVWGLEGMFDLIASQRKIIAARL